jgi:hypothetical protein
MMVRKYPLRKEMAEYNCSMSGASSTVTSKWQVTLPAEVRSEFPIEIGDRISWEVGRQANSVRNRAGGLFGWTDRQWPRSSNQIGIRQGGH